MRTEALSGFLEQRWERLTNQCRVASALVIACVAGFAVATVLIRLALTAPRVVDAGLDVMATIFALPLTWVYNRTATGKSRNPDEVPGKNRETGGES